MNNLKAGFARSDITPYTGIPLSGYFKERISDGVLDNLYANALALSDGKTTVLFIALDNAGMKAFLIKRAKKIISERTGLSEDAIIISATHTHTAPVINDTSDKYPLVEKYVDFLFGKMADAAAFAIADLKPAKAGYKIGSAPNVAFVRRFRMKNGAVRTNPGVGNPDIDSPIGDVDERVGVLRIDRDGADSILFVNFACHPDVVGGCKISADWPGIARDVIERALPCTKCIFVNGAEGDVNHVNVNAHGGDMNGLANDFDDVARGYSHSRHIANVVAGAVLQIFEKVNYFDSESIKFSERKIDVPANKADAKDLPLAHKYADLHNAGKDDEIPFKAMELTTAVAEALRMVRLENEPDYFEMSMTGVSLGDVAFITIPGEGFTYIGRELKTADGYGMVLTCGLSNGYEGYFPTKDAYNEGGYEARSSNFKAGVAEIFAENGKQILASLK